MQLTATLSTLLPLQTGTGKNGPWKKQDIIVETGGQYPKKICISVWGDRISTANLQPGDNLNISFDLESREYNGRWYTDVKAWKIEPADKAAIDKTPDDSVYADDNNAETPSTEENDDLPF